jgi:prepilin-type N-terminal cleavage/methylation domain-containing protein
MKGPMRKLSGQDGFSIIEMMVATAVVLVVLSGALTTFRNALAINDSASQLADANQNLRAGTNQLVRDLLMAGRIIGTQGVAMPTGSGISFARPGPVAMNFDLIADGDPTLQMPSISTGYHRGPTILGSQTDMITILTVDEFMPIVATPPTDPTTPTAGEGTISPDGTYVQFGPSSQWLDGDTVNDTVKIKVGDLVLYVGSNGNAIQTVTSIDLSARRIYFAVGDFFRFNQPNATNELAGTGRPLASLKRTNTKDAAGNPVPTNIVWPTLCPANPAGGLPNGPVMTPTSNFCPQVTLFKALMITYYVDNTTTPGTPRLTRVINNFAPQALAGVVEDLDLTYDLYDGLANPTGITGFPYSLNGTVYSENQVRKINIHVGVRSETMSQPTQDYVRNHITTSVNVRSLAAVDKYPS